MPPGAAPVVVPSRRRPVAAAAAPRPRAGPRLLGSVPGATAGATATATAVTKSPRDRPFPRGKGPFGRIFCDRRGRAHLDDVHSLSLAVAAVHRSIVRCAEFDMITFRNFRAAPQVRLVHEQVGTAAVGRDAAVPSFGVEPLADAAAFDVRAIAG